MSSNRIRSTWDLLAARPGGRSLFGLLLGRMAPYTGTIRPLVLELREGYARVAMRDRRAVRNHLHSVHAVALTNLAEVTSGLALHYVLPDQARAILMGLSIDFLKKGRGRLEAEASAPVPDGRHREELLLETVICDAAGEVVARAAARWLVGPREDASPSP